MKYLKDIKLKEFISLDIETVRIIDEYDNLTEGYKSAWKYDHKQEGVVPEEEILAEQWKKTASLDGCFSKVCAVSLVFLSKEENKLLCIELKGEDEYHILEALGEYLERAQEAGTHRLIAHAGKFFDYRFLMQRYIINRLDIPSILDDAHLKPWEKKNLCTNELWSNGSYKGGASLQALCTALDIPISKVDLVGDEVGKAFYNGEFNRIGEYCTRDALAAFNVICRLRDSDAEIYHFEDLVYIDKQESVKLPFLQRFFYKGAFDTKLEQELRDLIGKKKLKKKEKQHLKTILLGVYLREDFIKGDQDTKALREAKEDEIENFIDSL